MCQHDYHASIIGGKKELLMGSDYLQGRRKKKKVFLK
jgi:hypothetical protein